MANMSDILKLAERIKNRSLRKKVISTLKNPGRLSGKAFSKYPACDFTEAPASTNFHHVYKGGLLDHIYSVTRMALGIAEALEDTYRTEIDYDSLVAAALLHDTGKLWKMKKEEGAWTDTNIKLDHTMLWTSELYARGFPEHVVHIVASHFGEEGPTPPMTVEAMILHNVDNFSAKMGTVDQDALLQQILSQMGQEKG